MLIIHRFVSDSFIFFLKKKKQPVHWEKKMKEYKHRHTKNQAHKKGNQLHKRAPSMQKNANGVVTKSLWNQSP